MDQVNDFDYHQAIADRGVYIEYDSFGGEHYAEEWSYDFNFGHDSWRVHFLKRLIEMGHGDRLLVSQDVALKTDLRRFGGNGYAHVLTTIVPWLREIGVADEALQKVLVANPSAVLTVRA
jgi:phosphotriesterase-related protein